MANPPAIPAATLRPAGEFKPGDIVTRNGTDRQCVIWVNEAGDLMEVECIRAPLGWLNEDGTHDRPWCEVGECETNLCRRYGDAGDVIDA